MQEHVCEQRQEMELGTTFEQLLDRYMMLPFEERRYVELLFQNAIEIKERKIRESKELKKFGQLTAHK